MLYFQRDNTSLKFFPRNTKIIVYSLNTLLYNSRADCLFSGIIFRKISIHYKHGTLFIEINFSLNDTN